MNRIEELANPFQDTVAQAGVEIIVRHDGLVTWINVDGVCRMRIISNGLTVPITIEDNRNAIKRSIV